LVNLNSETGLEIRPIGPTPGKGDKRREHQLRNMPRNKKAKERNGGRITRSFPVPRKQGEKLDACRRYCRTLRGTDIFQSSRRRGLGGEGECACSKKKKNLAYNVATLL